MARGEVITSDQAYRRMRELAVEAGIAFSNGEIARNYLTAEGRNLRHRVVELRDALVYRFDGLLYHLDMMEKERRAAHMLAADGDPRPDTDLARQTSLRQRFLFDDVVFNAVSLFDYIGRFIGLTLQDDQNMKLRWDRCYKWAKHPATGRGKNHIYGTRTADIVVEVDEEWVRRLATFRSRVIHYESESVDGGHTIRFEGSPAGGQPGRVSHVLTSYVPRAFLRELRMESAADKVPIIEATDLLLDRVYVTAERILSALVDDLRDRVPELPPGAVVDAPMVVPKNPSSE